MKRLFTLFVLLLSAGAYCQTPVSGEQTGVWQAADSPFQVTGEIIVPAGQVLTIEPGVIITFQGNYKFTVNGTLTAEGTETDSIIFTTDTPQTGWHGIRLNASQSGSSFKYCRIEYGKTVAGSYPDQHGGGMMIYNSDATIENCTFADNEAVADNTGMGGAIYCFNTTNQTQIKNCLFTGNYCYGEGGAIKFSGDTGANVENCSFIDNSVLYGGGAICMYGCYDTHIIRSLFTGNVTSYSNGGAVFIEGYSARIVFVNCTMYDNHAQGGDGGAVEIAFSDASFTNCIIYSNPGAYSDNIYLDFGYAEVNYCDTPFPDGATGSNNINVNPQFIDPYGLDFHLSETSPCIDAGIDSLTITTAFNEVITVVNMDSTQYNGLAPDLGCYEYDPGTGITVAEKISFSVFPNPASGLIYLESPLSNFDKMTVSDIKGNIIETIYNPGNVYNLSKYKRGFYFITVNKGNKTLTAKVIKQ